MCVSTIIRVVQKDICSTDKLPYHYDILNVAGN